MAGPAADARACVSPFTSILYVDQAIKPNRMLERAEFNDAAYRCGLAVKDEAKRYRLSSIDRQIDDDTGLGWNAHSVFQFADVGIKW